MARIRTVKPEFWSHEDVLAVSRDARLLFIGLWNFCDDAGRHPFSPASIKAQVFPGDPVDLDTVHGWLTELSANGLIATYSIDGKEYLHVPGWRHQKIDKPQLPRHPGPNADRSPNARRKVATEGIGISIRDKGKEEDHSLTSFESSRARDNSQNLRSEETLVLTGLPPDWKPDDATMAMLHRFLDNPAIEVDLAKFRDWVAATGAEAADWNARFRNWCRRTGEQRGVSASRLAGTEPTPGPGPGAGPVGTITRAPTADELVGQGSPLWQAVKLHLLAEIGADALTSWFTGVDLVVISEGIASISTRSDFAAGKLRSQFDGALLRAFALATGDDSVQRILVTVVAAERHRAKEHAA